MKRRDFITLLGGAAAAWPMAARAQQGKRTRRIGVLIGTDDAQGQSWMAAFQQQLKQLGWVLVATPVDPFHPQFGAAAPATSDPLGADLGSIRSRRILRTSLLTASHQHVDMPDCSVSISPVLTFKPDRAFAAVNEQCCAT
jgi:hypothetical protein